MTIAERETTASECPTYDLIEELWKRDELGRAAREFKQRTRWTPWKRLRLCRHVWGVSSRWLAFCPWNGEEAWLTLPLFYLGVGYKHIEFALGADPIRVNVDIRWRWE